MTQHKWAKEIKAWADGAEIEFYHSSYARWVEAPSNPDWSGSIKYRIKPQPKQPKFVYLYKESNSSEIVIKEDEELNWSESYSIYIGKIEVQDD